MSFASLAGVFPKLWTVFLKICRWVFVNMSSTWKLSGFNGRLPNNLKLKKAKGRFQGSNSTRKLLYLWLLCVIIALLCYFWIFDGSASKKKEKAAELVHEETQIFLEQSNCEKQLHPYFESDQVLSM